MDSIMTKAHAKLNLTLEILGKRADGYHDRRSVFLAVSLADELEFTPRGDGRIVLDSNDPHLPADGRNLIVRAAQLLKQRYSLPSALGATITLKKNIPVGAGLGGGSSDAAATLMALSRLWGIADATPDELARLGAQAGSDVPFFILARSALVTGRGDLIVPAAFPRPYHFVVIYPGFPVSTAWAYKSLKIDLTKRPEYSKILLSHCLNGDEPDKLVPFFHNGLEPTVVRAHPGIAHAKDDLVRAGALGVMMSGSGSSAFGIFPGLEASRRALQQVHAAWPRSYAVSSATDAPE
jgi:4-diphosphocytidyl-2-C-methyl-D-erythritol kinase